MTLPEGECYDYLVFQFEGLLLDVKFLLGEGLLFEWWESVMRPNRSWGSGSHILLAITTAGSVDAK